MPFLYQKKSLNDAKTLLKWLVEQRNSAAIEHVTDAMLEDVIESHEYVAVLFTGEPQFNHNKPGSSLEMHGNSKLNDMDISTVCY